MSQEEVLQLGGGHTNPIHFDHLLDTIRDGDEPFIVNHTLVPRLQEAICIKCFLGSFIIVQVAHDYLGATCPDLTRLPKTRLNAFVLHQLDLGGSDDGTSHVRIVVTVLIRGMCSDTRA